jgi:hypothetical protein
MSTDLSNISVPGSGSTGAGQLPMPRRRAAPAGLACERAVGIGRTS